MISRIDLTGDARASVDPRDVLPRAELSVERAVEEVRPLCDDVRRRGAVAVREITARLDGIDLESARVPRAAIDQAVEALDPALRSALEEAIVRARRVHHAQVRDDVTVEVIPGGQVTEKWVPVGRVGLYVPGGLVAYPSSVVMNVVPAQVAGVGSIAVATPPQPENGGLPNAAVLAACGLLGVDEVYAVGGAQAIAMFAYGTSDCSRVDVVTGPGNIYVAAAKRLLKGVIGIDAEAGPTEIGILADAGADPSYLAADLIAQAEHDENASCLLVTDSRALLDAVDLEVADQLGRTHHRERVQVALSKQSAYVLVDDLDHGLEIVDEWAAEHLEVVTADAAERAAKVTNAGAIFVGPYSPVSLGDYLAGSNHVLPTGGTARHTAGLSVQSFVRGIHIVDYNRAALAASAPHIDALGAAEDLQAHVAAVRVRIPRDI
ncbi:MAG TPA: histidinol dehydrogenase [Actinomycetes bacterium]|nr:histidinol dehydrogenase [Actinomycetes bacterium]